MGFEPRSFLLLFFQCIVCWLSLESGIIAQPVSIGLSSRLDYYTHETSGEILVHFPIRLKGQTIFISLWDQGVALTESTIASIQARELISFPVSHLSEGSHTLDSIIRVGGRVSDTLQVRVVKRTHRANAVKIDRATGGLIVEDLPFFPVGFYCYSPVQSDLPDDAAVRGFNVISPYQDNGRPGRLARLRFMDRCAALGIKVHYHLLSVTTGGGVYANRMARRSTREKRRLLGDEIKTFRDHPALLAWHIADEPVAAGVPPDSLESIYRLVKTLDPYHPVSMVFARPWQSQAYSNALDVAMADPYPIPEMPLTEAGRFTTYLTSRFDTSTPVWIVPQAFGGNERWEREPAAREIRAMTWLALIRGATGIQYFIRHGLASFPKSPDAWAACGNLAREAAELTPFLLSASAHPDVVSSSPQVEARAWRRGDTILLAAVNTENQPLSVGLRLNNVFFTGKADLPFENRQVDVVRGTLEDVIDGLGTRIYILNLGLESNPIKSSTATVVNSSFEDNVSPGTPAGCYIYNGGDRGASALVDARTAYHGDRSLRLTTPEEGKGLTLAFFPVHLRGGQTVRLSIWARAADPLPARFSDPYRGLFRKLFPGTSRKSKPAIFRLALAREADAEFELTSDWRRYDLAVHLEGNDARRVRLSPRLTLVSQGKAWFDLLEVTPIIETEESLP